MTYTQKIAERLGLNSAMLEGKFASMSKIVRGILNRMPRPVRRPAGLAALRSYEAWQSVRARASDRWAEVPSSKYPLPAPHLRALVTGRADADFFVESGREQMQFIQNFLEQNGAPVSEMNRVLDFGCGCGRLARWLSALPQGVLAGCDYNPELVAWCAENLDFMETRVSALEPPLQFGDGEFDLIYALSVFTHLPEEMQKTWLAELHRVLRPGGLLFFTVSGEGFRDKLELSELIRFEQGELVVRFGELPGTNLCAVYHPPSFVTANFLQSFQLLDSRLQHADQPSQVSTLRQDAYLVRREV
jgi:SAM-dependent methyltransferase